MNQNKITLLDLGGVVFQSTGNSNEKINWEIITRLNHKYGHELNIGADKFPNFLEEYNQLFQQTLIPSEFLKEVFDTLQINGELIEFISNKSKIIIVSDNYRENINYISKRYQFESWADDQVYSFDYKMVKANPDFFKKLIEEFPDIDPKEMLLVDDSIEKIKSAKKNGIRGIHFQNNDQVINELKKYYV